MKWTLREYVFGSTRQDLYRGNESFIRCVDAQREVGSCPKSLAFFLSNQIPQNANPVVAKFRAAGWEPNFLGAYVVSSRNPKNFDKFIEVAIDSYPDLQELEDWMRTFVGLPPSISTIIKWMKEHALVDYESAKEKALEAQAYGKYEALTCLLDEISGDWERWFDLVHQMDINHPAWPECLERIFEYYLEQAADGRNDPYVLKELIRISLLQKSEELNRFCAEYVGWDFSEKTPLDFTSLSFEVLMPILDLFKAQHETILQLQKEIESQRNRAPARTLGLQGVMANQGSGSRGVESEKPSPT